MRPIDAKPLEEILRLRRAQCSNDYGSLAGAINGCLKLLQAQPTISPPPNDPLTLEQLREMDGEPVWFRNLCTGDYTCRVIAQSDEHFTHFTDGGLHENRSYGSYWLAYRCKLEEGMT